VRSVPVLLLLAVACSGPPRQGSSFIVGDFYDEYLPRRAKLDPNWASAVGIHDHDRRLTRFDDETRSTLRFLLADMLLRLRTLDLDLLPVEQQLDYKLWRAQLETELYEMDRRDERKIMPDLPLGSVDTIYVMLIKDFAPLRERAENALHRLGELPAVLGDIRSKLTDPPRVWTEMAIEDGRGAVQGIDEIVRLIKTGVEGDGPDKAGAAAKQALQGYVDFLEKDLLPHSTGSFALGKPIYDLYLQRYHLLRLDADQLIGIGKSEWDRTIAMLEECAKTIDPARKWTDILESMKKDHPPAAEVVEAYRRETAKARQFIIVKSLVSLPQDEKLEILETPAFSRSSIPYAAYQPPGPLDAARTGHFYVTPVDPGASAEEAEAQLAGHNIYDIPGTVWHEAYPGHHTQFVLAKNVTSKIRRLNPSPLLSEGWGFYCEELAHESGYFTDPRMRLMQLNWRLQRAARVILDASLHSGRMTFEEAVTFLVEKVRLEKTSAIRSARGYARNPAYFMAYMIGMLEIVRIREDAKKRLGERFSLMEFHDRVLRYGNVPPGLIEGELVREWR
jgi:uncharacterized protein (DUF885 family)